MNITNKINSNNLLRITLAAGLILIALALVSLAVFFLIERSGSREERQQINFSSLLREYDVLFTETAAEEKDIEQLNRHLDRLEKLTLGVESWLSVLKRRRTLAFIYPPYMENYRKSLNSALKEYPMSQPVIALAAEALIRNTAVNRVTQDTLRGLLENLTDNNFNNLRLSLHVLLGDFKTPGSALRIPASLFHDGTESVAVNLAIMKILGGNIQDAAADIQSMFYSLALSADALRFAAEFFYDFGSLQRSAEIFSIINDERAITRMADALYIAGYPDIAKTVWTMLGNLPGGGHERSLYNLAVTAQDRDEAAVYLEKMINAGASQNEDSLPASTGGQKMTALEAGVIRYSRLLGTAEAIEALERARLQPLPSPFIDLELCRRQSEGQPLGRQIANAWMLLDRHYENEDLYNWAAWLFLFQRSFSEMEILLNRMETLTFSSGKDNAQWHKIYRAVYLMQEGDVETAEAILRSIPGREAQWAVFANLGRILEAQRLPSRALEQYELAAEKAENPKTASVIQTRIARCYSVLNRPSDAILALLRALELDSENLAAALELDRMSY